MVTSWMYMGHGLLLDGWIWDMGYCYMDVYGTNFPLLTKSGKKNTVFSVMYQSEM